MPYSDWTYNAKNPLRRFSHRKRMIKSVNLALKALPEKGRLLDFGCADGYMVSLLQQITGPGRIFGYEPYPDSKVDESTIIYNRWDDVAGQQFDVVTCFEVLEHFSPDNQRKLLRQIRSLLKAGGTLIISVPVEYGPVGVFKGVLRKVTDRRQRHWYSWRNIARTLLSRPIEGARDSDGYLDHVGFYYRALTALLNECGFTTVSRSFSPYNFGGAAVNSQIYTVLKRK